MVLQIFNEALQCVIYRVMVGAAGVPQDSEGVRFLLQEGREETTERQESQGLAN